MKEPDRGGPSPWADALLTASLLAIDPHGLGGVCLRALPGPARERWLAYLRACMGERQPLRRLPLHAADSRLLGGLDLAATLRAGRPVAERGILADTDGGVLVAAMAERMHPATAAKITAVLDGGAVVVERDGLAIDTPARFGVVALDEGMTADERPPAALLDRLAFWLDFAGLDPDRATAGVAQLEIVAARALLPAVETNDETVAAFCQTAMALGIASLRAPQLAVKAARAHAALMGRAATAEDDLLVAARLVVAPRATVIPLPEEPNEQDKREPEAPPPADSDEGGQGESDRPLADRVLDAARTAIPAGLLETLGLGGPRRPRPAHCGGAGHLQKSKLRGRPAGTRHGDPRAGARLDVVETLRAAAPWQPLRRQERAEGGTIPPGQKVEVRRDDFRITRFKQQTETTTIFVVDASGSAALHRLAEAKGAVELMLAECYVRRDSVALIAFRGRMAELLLPPTRSLVRAKRQLAGLPGGGGTPLAIAIDLAVTLADQVVRRGQSAVAIFLTDGQTNIARDGTPGRGKAEEDALAAARALRAAGLAALLVDTAPHPKAFARKLAAEMGASYLALPYADATAISAAARAAAPPPA
ncbi:MAG: magnesium chelatase subunit D [Xanthobacteraceae bacterium]